MISELLKERIKDVKLSAADPGRDTARLPAKVKKGKVPAPVGLSF